jgi:hypothetical protein
MAATLYDLLTGTPAAAITGHTSESGHTWAVANGQSDTVVFNTAGTAVCGGSSTFANYKSSWTPASADYTVGADITIVSRLSNQFYLIARMAANGTGGYSIFTGDGGLTWKLYKNGVRSATPTALQAQ